MLKLYRNQRSNVWVKKYIYDRQVFKLPQKKAIDLRWLSMYKEALQKHWSQALGDKAFCLFLIK